MAVTIQEIDFRKISNRFPETVAVGSRADPEPRPNVDYSVYSSIRHMSKSVRVSEPFHEFVKAHKREDETMEDTLRRLIGGPHPEDVAGILSPETAAKMRDRLETKEDSDVEAKGELRERFE